MMKRAILSIAAAAFAFAPSVSHAQRSHSAESPVKFSLNAGLVMPMSDWGDAVGTGLGINALGTKALSGSPMFLRGEVGFNYYMSKDQGGGVSTKGNQIGGAFDLGYSFPSSSTVKPYVLGGLNIHRTSLTADLGTGGGTTSDNSGAKFGFNGGVGMRFKMGAHVAHVEGRYMNQGTWNGASIASFPISFGVEF
ncbi:MAG: outer membrane beta-barrel protein [Gemmatimonadaceae bacterium]|nr:outer membrane beta-barrel protein [Gemmatimonadaceae bacterium]